MLFSFYWNHSFQDYQPKGIFFVFILSTSFTSMQQLQFGLPLPFWSSLLIMVSISLSYFLTPNYFFIFFSDFSSSLIPLTLPSPFLGCLIHFVSVITISIWTISTSAMCRRSPMCDSIIQAEGQSCCSQRQQVCEVYRGSKYGFRTKPPWAWILLSTWQLMDLE